jgi:1,4-dihydroxy-2-naphthoate octaprenyltransferase
MFYPFFLALPVFWERGFFLVGVGLLCLLMTLSYTGGPFPLFAYLGLGEVFVLIFLDGSLLALATLSRREFFSESATVLG